MAIVAPEQGGNGVLHVQPGIEAGQRVADGFFVPRQALLFERHRLFAIKRRLKHFAFGVDDRRAVFQDDQQLFDDPVEDDGLVAYLEPAPALWVGLGIVKDILRKGPRKRAVLEHGSANAAANGGDAFDLVRRHVA